MKRTIVAVVALAFVLLSAGAALAGIAGSKHDMRTHLTGQTGGYDEVCVYCHTPHSSATAAQLWNHTGTVASFTTYTNTYGTLDATMGAPGAGSLLCLSCHDGTVAVDAMVNLPNYGVAGTNNSTFLTAKAINNTSGAYMGTDLTNDHPIGFNYDAALVTADGSLVDATTVGNSTYVRIIGGVGGKVECASCHDAHNTVTMPFLRSTNAGSQLCLQCHNK